MYQVQTTCGDWLGFAYYLVTVVIFVRTIIYPALPRVLKDYDPTGKQEISSSVLIFFQLRILYYHVGCRDYPSVIWFVCKRLLRRINFFYPAMNSHWLCYLLQSATIVILNWRNEHSPLDWRKKSGSVFVLWFWIDQHSRHQFVPTSTIKKIEDQIIDSLSIQFVPVLVPASH